MSWVYVNRFMKTEKNKDKVKELVDANVEHWRGVALDLGYDPDKNVMMEEGDKLINIAITEEMDMTMREEPGEWRGGS
jgi:hypothetical protein